MAAASKKGLGKGLSALMSEEYSQVGDSAPGLQSLAVRSLVAGPFQPRRHFDEETLRELATSIEKNGIMQPLVVRPVAGGRYEIVAGERRWRAAKMANLDEVPVIIRELDDRLALELALVENIQRMDLGPLEEALGYRRLMDEFSYTQETLAQSVGKSRSHIANLLRLLVLPESVKEYLEKGQLTMGHARALINVDEAERLAEEVVRKGLNVRQTEALCRAPSGNEPAKGKRSSRPSAGRPSTSAKDPDIVALEETLSDNLGLTVSIEDDGMQGRLIIAYESLNQLDDILKRLGGNGL